MVRGIKKKKQKPLRKPNYVYDTSSESDKSQEQVQEQVQLWGMPDFIDLDQVDVERLNEPKVIKSLFHSSPVYHLLENADKERMQLIVDEAYTP